MREFFSLQGERLRSLVQDRPEIRRVAGLLLEAGIMVLRMVFRLAACVGGVLLLTGVAYLVLTALLTVETRTDEGFRVGGLPVETWNDRWGVIAGGLAMLAVIAGVLWIVASVPRGKAEFWDPRNRHEAARAVVQQAMVAQRLGIGVTSLRVGHFGGGGLSYVRLWALRDQSDTAADPQADWKRRMATLMVMLANPYVTSSQYSLGSGYNSDNAVERWREEIEDEVFRLQLEAAELAGRGQAAGLPLEAGAILQAGYVQLEQVLESIPDRDDAAQEIELELRRGGTMSGRRFTELMVAVLATA